MIEVNKIYHGSCLDIIKNFPDKSIDMVCTSPPYWQLRDYKWDGQWGLEPTFQMYLENLWSLMDEVYRVLKDTGTVWINLGDTYSTTSGGSNQLAKGDITQYGLINHENRAAKQDKKGLPSKCLLLIPHRFAIGCIDRGWIIRNDIIWAKRNGMPESVTDRFSKKHEYFFLMVKSEKYYFDLDGIRENHKQVSIERYKRGVNENKYTEGADGQTMQGIFKKRPNLSNVTKEDMFGEEICNDKLRNKAKENYGLGTNNFSEGYRSENNPNGKNPGTISDFWDIPTQGSKDAHYASYSTKLIDKPIVAGCPIGGIILDPFCGTATTGCRAIDLQRKFIGIEGKEEYVKIGNKKLLPFQITQQLF